MPSYKYFFIALVILLLNGCANQPKSISNESEVSFQSIQPSIGTKNDIENLDAPSDQFMMDLRETMNLSFKIFQAMEHNDYSFLESSKASGVLIDKEKNKVIYKYKDNVIEYDFLKGIHLNNLEYWGSGYTDSYSNFQIVFARYFDDTHGTIYFDFIKEENKWLFSGISTNE